MNTIAMNKPASASRHALDTRPWYKQFWPWVLFGLPALAVVASFISLTIAIEKSDDLVEDNYYKDGLAINRQLAADDAAKALGLRARLAVDPQTRQLQVHLDGSLPRQPQQLLAHFMHPVSADDDFSVTLTRSNNIFAGVATRIPSGRWTVEIIDPANSAWRLRREIALPIAAKTVAEFDIAP